MKVVFFTSAVSNTFCGVVDYTKKLSAAITEQNVENHIEAVQGWSFLRALKPVLKHSSDRNTIFHLQYPSMGMGKSLVPGLLPLLLYPHKTYVMLHEFYIFNILRKLSFLPHAIFSKKIFFSNKTEEGVFLKFFPFAQGKTIVVPIGINIPVYPVTNAAPGTKERIVYFGQILEGKGIEFYLDTVRALRAQNFDFDAAIIGAVVDNNNPVYRLACAAAEKDNITLILNRSEQEVSAELQNSTIAVLAFPDGITEKRGSALACLKHNMATITIHSEKTPEWLRKTTHQASSPAQAAQIIQDIADRKIARFPDKNLLDQELGSREWSKIAQKHIEVYKS